MNGQPELSRPSGSLAEPAGTKSIPSDEVDERSAADARFVRLRWYNALMGLFHAAQGVAILLLATSFALPITASFMEGPPGSKAPPPETIWSLPLAWGVAAFVFISAAAHWSLASFGYRWYVRNLQRNRNYARWIEYSLSSSVMIVLIAMLCGISDLAALIAIFGVNAAMILFGWLMEKYEQPGTPSWLAFIFGSMAGIVPWIIIAIYFWGPGTTSSPPGFVYGIVFSLFVFFNSFAVNMMLQYKRVGPWRDYLFGERMYVLLSLVAKSLLAWQVFAGSLAG